MSNTNTKLNSLQNHHLRRSINTSGEVSEDSSNRSITNDVSDIKSNVSNTSQLDFSLDLSLKRFWIIVHYPFSDPGNEYEILSEKDLECDSWETLAKGVAVTVKYGNAKVQGYVVTVSDDYSYLKSNFKNITEEYDKECFNARKKCRKSRPRKQNVSYPENRPFVEERLVIKVMDRETQTDIETTQSADNTQANIEYLELKRKYEDLKNEYEKFNSLFTDVKIGLQNTMVKLDNVKFSPIVKDNIFNSNNCSTPKINALRAQNFNNNGLVLRSNNSNKIKGELNLNESDILEDKENYDPNAMVQIGSKGTKIPQQVYNNVKWSNYSAATRKLLITLFPRDVLATHSLSGRPSPAFLTSDKQTKMRLTPTIIADIVEVISTKCGVSEALVRNVITTKCADENKMFKKRQEKRKSNENNESSNLTDDSKRLKQK